ncbi:MAG: hypothetical protein AAFP89_25730 [Bacteroidota bacterium]
MYYRMNFQAFELNYPSTYDTKLDMEVLEEFEQSTFSLLESNLPDNISIPRKIEFSQGVEPRDILMVHDLSDRGLVCTKRVSTIIQEMNIPDVRVVELKIYYSGRLVPYFWVVFEPLNSYYAIDYTQSSFYREDGFGERQTVLIDSAINLLKKIKTAKSLREIVYASRIVLLPGFEFDIFSFPRLFHEMFCSGKVKEIFTSSGITGIEFITDERITVTSSQH